MTSPSSAWQPASAWQRIGWLCGLTFVLGVIVGGLRWQFPATPFALAAGDDRASGRAAELNRELAVLRDGSQLLARIAQLTAPSVVHIESRRDDKKKGMVEETGSGIVIAGKAGGLYVVTNRHVVNGADLRDIACRLSDGREIRPEQQWADRDTDLAVLKISATGVPAASWGDSNQVEIGHMVLAFGSPFGLSQSVTFGIISAKGRRSLQLGAGQEVLNQDFLQTDAAINPGNSGGPLVDLQGRIIGINTAIASSSGGNEGIGFAIPSNLAQRVVEQLLQYGSVHRAYLGVRLDNAFDAKQAERLRLDRARGARVVEVYPNTPASRAAVMLNDVILSFDGVDVQDETHLINLVSLTPIGRQIRMVIWRDGRQMNLNVTLADRSELPTGPNDKREPAPGSNVRPMGLEVAPVDGDLSAQLGLSEAADGLLVLSVDPTGPLAGQMESQDLITAIGQIPVRSLDDLEQALQALEGRKSILLSIQRLTGGETEHRRVVWRR